MESFFDSGKKRVFGESDYFSLNANFLKGKSSPFGFSP